MKKYGYAETRQISSSTLRSVCIREDWFNAGTNEEYAALLNKADEIANVTIDDLVELATIILEHSNIRNHYCSDDEYFCNMLYILANDACYSVFDINQ